MPRLRSLRFDETKPISTSILSPTFWSRLWSFVIWTVVVSSHVLK
jgi:hypothetical protein